MRFLRNIVSSIVGGSSGKVDALHYFVTEVPARKKKKVFRVIIRKVDREQKAVVDKGRRLADLRR